MRLSSLCLISKALLGLLCSAATHDGFAALERTPVVLELFTSEGCSSCPPADRFLQSLDQQQPFPNVELIVMSEHVDYWNHLGWKDPYSAKLFSARQERYRDQFGRDDVYTPQLVIDGKFETSGNSPEQVKTYVGKSAQSKKAEVTLSEIVLNGKGIRFHVSSAGLPKGTARTSMFIALAQDRASSDVRRGENAGRSLTHVAVVRALVPVGTLEAGSTFAKDVTLPLAALVSQPSHSIRLIAFLQDSKSQAILGATLKRVP